MGNRLDPIVSVDVLGDLLRGSGQVGRAANERFPTAAQIVADPTLALEQGNPFGKLFVGLTCAAVHQEWDRGVLTRWTSGGQLVAIGDDRHIIMVAGTRAGKGRSVILPNLLLYPGSVVVVDPKGDLATETAAYRARVLGQQVFVLDPEGLCGSAAAPHRATWNPLRLRGGESDDELIDIASLVADSLVIPDTHGDPHWNDTARAFIFTTILHVLTAPAYANRRTLDMVLELLMVAVEERATPNQQRSTLHEEMLHNTTADGAVMMGAAAFYDKEVKERTGVLSSVRRHTHFLLYGNLKRTLADSDRAVDLHRLPEQPTTIYLSIPPTKLGVWAGFSRMFVNLTLGAFERSPLRDQFQKRSGRLPTLMVLDEFAALKKMDRLVDAAAQLAGLGLRIFPIVQDLGQIRHLYGPQWESFVANAGTVVCFGMNDITTLEWVEKRLGMTTVVNPSLSHPTIEQARSGATGSSFSVSTHPLMAVPEISRVFNRDDHLLRMLVISAAHGPMILQRALCDRHEAFVGLRARLGG